MTLQGESRDRVMDLMEVIERSLIPRFQKKTESRITWKNQLIVDYAKKYLRGRRKVTGFTVQVVDF